MKLNPDCLRDILLYIEDVTDLDNHPVIEPTDLPAPLNSYESSEVMYHIKQAELSNLILDCKWYMDGSCSIKYLTPDGHQFVGNIQSPKLWSKVKSITQDAGVNTLRALIEIASKVALASIQSHV